ncbi:MAG: hypothetical protein WBC19_11865 [Pyrinomonadaceae bacterium]
MAFPFGVLKPAPRAESMLFSSGKRIFGRKRQFSGKHLLLFG